MSATAAYSSTGRRKTSTARVSITPGSGIIQINGRSFEDYCPTVTLQNQLLQPLAAVDAVKNWDISVNASGGGVRGQVGAIRLGIARSLIQHDPELRPALKAGGFLMRDPRAKERKKPGQPGARKRFQFSKR
jgi:small subunit ribosomal protein S9